MERLLVDWRGYNVPQREGHFMQVFSFPADAVNYHADLQRELLHEAWPAGLASHPLATPFYDLAPPPGNRGSGENGELLYHGLTVSLGMSVGPIAKSLERGRANYLGPTCNRAARVCGLAKQGQLLMCADEFQGPMLASLRAGTDPRRRGHGALAAEVVLAGAVLKGIKGAHDIVRLGTDSLAARRAAVPRGFVAAAAATAAAASPQEMPQEEPAAFSNTRRPVSRGSAAIADAARLSAFMATESFTSI
jgi:hypothetical protein